MSDKPNNQMTEFNTLFRTYRRRFFIFGVLIGFFVIGAVHNYFVHHNDKQISSIHYR